eukprot:TRINITY_DN61290_c0_g1_i1.p1 TRINITY_DN61290_c0_g1~~TRINITY_DN61290_c0_g1_i1.p1  ORF type:complete len:676 (+),score=150.17 TRINITY_DN61290_c0_g1_i1:32-2059(+)
MFASVLILLAFTQAPAAAVEAPSEAEALAQDDECSASDNRARCAMDALQRRGKMTTDGESGASLEQMQAMFSGMNARIEQLSKENTELQSRLRTLEERTQKHPDLPGGIAPPVWNGGGSVDDMNGFGQVEIMNYRERNWKIGSIVYQIFVDRFVPPEDVESKRPLHPPPQVLHSNWSTPVKNGVPTDGLYYSNELEFWGGDLKSLETKLDYVKEIAEIVYLQPIFEAFSVHKYDTTNYKKLDPTYGTMHDFKALERSIHKKGMYLMLDGVFNHAGVKSTYFQEALKNSSAKERDWFFFGDNYKRGYKTWQNGNTLVELHLEDKSLQDFIWNRNDSVIAHWLKQGADGFRLDVGTELGREVLWRLTSAAHRHKFNSYIVGEVSAYPRWWTEAMDGVMSFWMGWQIQGLVNQVMAPDSVADNIRKLITQSSMEQVLRSWIVVSNHDLPRMVNQYPDRKVHRLVLGLMMTLPGSPCLYYGEELGMSGAGDPSNRAPMAWDKVTDDNEILNYTRTLVDIRKKQRALKIGDWHSLDAKRIFAFSRRTDRVEEVTIVLANVRNYTITEMVSVPDENILEYTLFKDLLSGDTVRIHGATCTIKMPPQSLRILAMQNEVGNPNGDQYKRIYGHWATFPDISAEYSAGKWIDNVFWKQASSQAMIEDLMAAAKAQAELDRKQEQ